MDEAAAQAENGESISLTSGNWNEMNRPNQCSWKLSVRPIRREKNKDKEVVLSKGK